MDAEELRFAEALEQQANEIDPPDGLAAIQARLIEPSAKVIPFRTPDRSGRSRRRNGVVAGVVAIGLAAAATIFAVSGGINQQASPDPAKNPLSNKKAATFDPPQPGGSFTIYRIGDDPSQAGEQPALFEEYARNKAPYAPRQALDALFTTPPVDKNLSDLFNAGSNKVASTEETENAIVVDMAKIDRAREPAGTVDNAGIAAVWVQAWVDTIQDAYNSDKPVLITLKVSQRCCMAKSIRPSR